MQGIDEIKDLLSCPRSPVPTYSPPAHSSPIVQELTLSTPKFAFPGQHAPIDSTDIKVHNTPLHEAARRADIVEVPRALAISKIDVNAQDDDGHTALHTSTEAGHARIVKLLCQKQADPGIEDLSGATALHHATSHGHEEIVRHLLQNGATDTVKDDAGRFAIEYAEEKSDHLIMWMLNHGADLEARDREGNTALMDAVKQGNLELIKALYSAAPNLLDAQNDRGTSTLMIAACNGNTEILHLLLDNRPRLNLKDKDGYIALL